MKRYQQSAGVWCAPRGRNLPRTSVLFRIALAAIAIGWLASSLYAAAQTTSAPAPATSAAATSAANPSPASTTATSTGGIAPTPTAAPAVPRSADRRAVLSYLGQVISWSRHLEMEERLATEPAETLFVADDRQMVDEVLSLAFEYARAGAALLKRKAGPAAGETASSTIASGASEPAATAALAGANPLPGLDSLIARRNAAQAEVEHLKARVRELTANLANGSRRVRDRLNPQLASAQGELDLAQSRVDSIGAMIEFETGTGASGPHVSNGLEAQIDELERSVPQFAAQQKQQTTPAAVPPPAAAPTSYGILEGATGLTALRSKQQTLDDTIKLTDTLLGSAERLRAPLTAALRDIDQRAQALAAQAGAGDVAAIKQRKADFEQLTADHKLVSNALLPLSKQMVILKLYTDNLARWRDSVDQRFDQQLKRLLLRIFALALLLLIVFGAALLWRMLTFRYVEDLQRRHQLLQLRRFVVIVIVALILLFDFANQLGSLATVMGFAAAGIAVTLQNVILSIAGYFYVSGRYGIRTGDRVQISGINGDVLEIGLFKMTLMELSAGENGHQPTGRAVVFPNSVVFQTNGNFFKQLPGSTFTWNELRLTLAPECDYRLAEKRLVEVVNDVFARYRDAVQREYRGIERELNLRIETPRPQSRLQLGANGIEMVIRYPAQLRSAVQTSDEIARRLVDAIKREPGLKLVAAATPAIQPSTNAESPPAKLGVG